MKYKLEEIAIYSNKKIEIDKINLENYISTENMLSNKAGITKATTLPNQSKVSLVEINNILISNIRPYFKKIWFANFDGGCSNDVLNIMVNDKTKVLPKYLYYNLFQDSFFDYVMSGNKGTKMPRGDKGHIMQYIINIPDIGTQLKVVKILETIDKKIELNNQINDNLHELVKSIYKEWFENEDILNNGIFDKLGNYIDLERGLSYKGKFLADEGIPMVNLGNVMPNGVFRLEKNKYYTGDYKEKVTAKVGDIVIANTDMTQDRAVIGTPVIIPPIYEGSIIFSHHIYGVKNLKLPKMYIFYSLLSNKYNNIVAGSAIGTTVLALPKEVILNYDILIPNRETLEQFEEIASTIQKRREQIILENIQLEKLRDTLLPKLMNGKIDLDKIEI